MRDTKVEVAAELGHSNIKNDLTWTQRIGWTIVGGFTVVFIGLITWYLPKEFENNRQVLHSDMAQQLGSMTQDVAVLKSQIASISAIIPELMKQKIKGKGAQLKKGLDSVGSIAKKVREQEIDTDPKAVGQVGLQVLQIADKNPDIAPAAWEATVELLNYQSFLNRKAMPNISGAKPIPVPDAVKFFNTACISPTWPAFQGGTTFGDSGVGIVQGPGQHNVDLALIKQTKLPWPNEVTNLEFRTEFFRLSTRPSSPIPTPIPPTDLLPSDTSRRRR